MRHAEHPRDRRRGGRRETVAAALLVALVTAAAAAALLRRGDGGAELRPRDETAVAVQAYVRRSRPAAVVTGCAATGRLVPRVNGRVYRCTVRSPGSGYRATLCVTLSEDVVRAVAPARAGRCARRH